MAYPQDRSSSRIHRSFGGISQGIGQARECLTDTLTALGHAADTGAATRSGAWSNLEVRLVSRRDEIRQELAGRVWSTTDKYSVRLPVSVAEKLIILKYFTHNVWSKRKIAGRLLTGPDKPPTPPGDAESSEKAKEEFIRRMAERKKEMETRRLWQEGLADEPVAADFGDTLGLDINGDDAVRASLEELIRLSASGHPDIEPLALNIANASAVDALLSENLPDWSRAPMKGGLAEHSQKLRKARSSVELRTGAGSINTQGKDNAGGTSGNRPTVGRDRHDPRYPDAPPVPPLPANNEMPVSPAART